MTLSLLPIHEFKYKSLLISQVITGIDKGEKNSQIYDKQHLFNALKIFDYDCSQAKFTDKKGEPLPVEENTLIFDIALHNETKSIFELLGPEMYQESGLSQRVKTDNRDLFYYTKKYKSKLNILTLSNEYSFASSDIKILCSEPDITFQLMINNIVICNAVYNKTYYSFPDFTRNNILLNPISGSCFKILSSQEKDFELELISWHSSIDALTLFAESNGYDAVKVPSLKKFIIIGHLWEPSYEFSYEDLGYIEN